MLTLLARRRPSGLIRAVTITSRTSRRRRACDLFALLAALPLLGACQTSGDSVSVGPNSNSGTDAAGTADTASYTVGEPVARIVFAGRAGDVRVTAKDGPIGVTERARYTATKPVTSHATNGDTLELKEIGCPNRPSNAQCQVAWEITAPAGTVLELETNVGDIDLDDMSGKVTVRSGVGKLTSASLASKQVNATADTGDIRLAFTVTPDEVTATTDVGDVRLDLPSGAYAVRTSGNVGDENVRVRVDQSSPHRIKATSDVGDVEITSR